MINLRLIRVQEPYLRLRGLQNRLLAIEGVCIAGSNFAGSLPKEMVDRIRKLDERQKVVVLNQPTVRGHPPKTLQPLNSEFVFRSLHKNGANTTLLETSHALVERNYFLCIEGVEDEVIGDWDEPQNCAQFDTYEYRCHISLEEVFRWRNQNQPYVNLDRDPDSIGYSSWDGNLVSWFRSEFSTRIHFARQAGLISTEE
jgi:hypothetical protein